MAATPRATAVRPRPRRGFTLIELLVVLAIVALLATIALPRWFGALDTAREQALAENLRVLRVSIDRFRGDTGRFPADLQELVSRRYLRAVPVDPVTESDQTWVLLPREGEEGVADVRSGAPGTGRDGRAFAEL
jgi:general secretion pathway protein G